MAGRLRVLDFDGVALYRIKYRGSLYGGRIGRHRGCHRTVEDVAAALGPSFALLEEAA
jgi:hypothetical protein